MMAMMMMMMMMLFLLSCGGGGVLAEQKKEVTVELYGRAESDVTFAKYLSGVAFNEFKHLRALTPLDEQKVVRMNRDTLYSFVVVDFGKCTPSGVKLIFPPAENIGDRFVSAEIISQDHDIIATKYLKDDVDGSGIEITPSDVGTDKALVLLRTFTDGTDDDLTKAHAVQDLFSVVPINGEEGDESSCQASKEEYMAEVAMWDKDSLATVRDLIKELQKHSNATSGEMFGPNRDELNYLYYLFGTATGWGGQPSEDAVYIYSSTDPTVLDTSGKVAYQLTIPDAELPLVRDPTTGDFVGFWSITVYNKDGFMQPNALGVNRVNSVKATNDGGPGTTITFAPEAHCEALPTNCLPITPSWSYIIRLYVPEQALIDGSYEMPKPVKMTKED